MEGIKKYRQEGADMVGLLADIEPEVMDEHIALYGVRTDPVSYTHLDVYKRQAIRHLYPS